MATEYETVTVSGEQNVEVGDGENLTNKLYDLSEDGAGLEINMRGESSLTNIGFQSECTVGGAEPPYDAGVHIRTSGQALIDTVYLGDGCVPGHVCPLFANKNTSGSVTVRHANIQDWPDNAAYVSPPAKDGGGGGEVHFENCYFARCTSGLYRIGFGSMTNCVAINDDPGARTKLREKDRGPNKPKGSEVRGCRGVWCRNGGNALVESSVIWMPHETTNTMVEADDDGSSVTVKNSKLGPGSDESVWGDGDVTFTGCSEYQLGDPLPGETTTSTVSSTQPLTDGGGVPAPSGVPLTAEEAASGDAQADGETVPPGGTPGGSGAGGTTGSSGAGGIPTNANCDFVKATGVGAGGGGGVDESEPATGTTVTGTLQPGETAEYAFSGEVLSVTISPNNTSAAVTLDGETINPDDYTTGTDSEPVRVVKGEVAAGETASFEFGGELTSFDITPTEGPTVLVDGTSTDPSTL